MIVTCKDCGKKYRIDPSKIIGRTASFKCRVCAHQILVSKPDSVPANPLTSTDVPRKPAGGVAATEPRPALKSTANTFDESSAAATSDTGEIIPARTGAAFQQHSPKRGFGLWSKKLMLFLLIPTAGMVGAGLFILWQIETTSELLRRESGRIINQMAEEKIGDLAVAVAEQCKLYLQSHPELRREDFNKSPVFKSMAVQKVGQTGHTALYQLPDSDGVWRTWAHIDSKIIAMDMRRMKQSLGKNFAGFWKIYTRVADGKESRGYYTRQDNSSKFRDKFMVCTPIAGTRFVIAAATYLDEFTEPVRIMEAGAKKITEKAKFVTLAVLGATVLIFGLTVSIFSHRLTGKIKSSTKASGCISAGEPGREIQMKSKGEIV